MEKLKHFHFLFSLKRHHFYLGGALFLIASLATAWWITQAKPSKILNQAFAASCFWEGPGITANYEEANGKVNIISRDSYWVYNGTNWTINGQPFSQKISPLPGKGGAGRFPWEGPGITATYYGGGSNLNIVSKDYYWIYDGSSWTTSGKHFKDRFNPGPSKGKAGRLPWEGPGITAAYYGSGGNLNIISQDYYWIKKDKDWTTNGQPLKDRFNPGPSKGKAGRLPWEGPGITAAYQKGDGNIVLISQNYYWEKSGNSWLVSGDSVTNLFTTLPDCGSTQTPTPSPTESIPNPSPTGVVPSPTPTIPPETNADFIKIYRSKRPDTKDFILYQQGDKAAAENQGFTQEHTLLGYLLAPKSNTTGIETTKLNQAKKGSYNFLPFTPETGIYNNFVEDLGFDRDNAQKLGLVALNKNTSLQEQLFRKRFSTTTDFQPYTLTSNPNLSGDTELGYLYTQPQLCKTGESTCWQNDPYNCGSESTWQKTASCDNRQICAKTTGVAACQSRSAQYTFLTYNITWSTFRCSKTACKARARELARYLASRNPDVIGLQEVWTKDLGFFNTHQVLFNELKKYGYVDSYFHSDKWPAGGIEGNSIFSKYLMVEKKSKTYAASEFSTRIDSALVKFPAGSVRVLNLHADNPTKACVKGPQIWNYANTFPKDTVVVIGDFNMSYIAATRGCNYDLMAQKFEDSCNPDNVSSCNRLYKIDYIFYTKIPTNTYKTPWQVFRTFKDFQTTWISDHLPVVSTFNVLFN